MGLVTRFPPQQIPFSKKTKSWRKQILDWGSNLATIDNHLIRSTTITKKINFDLISGKVNIRDMIHTINPSDVKSNNIPKNIQHYPIINSKINVLRGEESRRTFEFKVVITNPNAISEMENMKKAELLESVTNLLDAQQSPEEFSKSIEEINQYYTYEWQDMREVRANALLTHYVKEYNIPFLFNQGFLDALAVSEEIYQCDIVAGEPVIEKLNPNKVRVFKSGYSNRIEDADIIVIEDYWSPSKVIDTFYDVLTKKDIDYIENLPYASGKTDGIDNVDARGEFIRMQDDTIGDAVYKDGFFFGTDDASSLLPYDLSGNIRVMKMYWKSRRKIKKIKYYDDLGTVQYKFREENYTPNELLGEEEEVLYINEAWEGTKIGEDIYVNMRPRPIQYNRLDNPSKCHFGIIGSIYSINDDKPFSFVEMMKPFNYLYDVVHDRLNKLIAKNWGKIITLDLAKVPSGWDVEKWLHFAKSSGIAVVDSFKEGNIGAATGKLAGGMSGMQGVIDAELGNSIQQHINLLEFIKLEMSDVVGISKQREGQISNRETVGGIERATLQSSNITEWVFTIHEDIKKRVLECFLETAKIALRGRSKKFQFILPDGATKLVDIDGDLFSELDYGLVVDANGNSEALQQKLDSLAQAALQNQTLNFSTIMKLYGTASLAEKQRMVEKNEQDLMRRQDEQAQIAQQQQQQAMQAEQERFDREEALRRDLNTADNETRIEVAKITASARVDTNTYSTDFSREKYRNDSRIADTKLSLDRQRLNQEREKAYLDHNIKQQQINNNGQNNQISQRTS